MIKYDPDILWDLQSAIAQAWDIDGISGDSLSETLNKFDLIIERAPTITESDECSMTLKSAQTLEEQIEHWRKIRATIASWRK